MAGKAAAIAGAAWTSTWVALNGWTAAATIVLITVVIAALLVWILASAERTARLRSLIIASRSQRRRSAEK